LPKRTKAKSRTDQKRPARRPGQEFPIMPLVVGGVFTVVLVALLVLFKLQSSTHINGQPVANIRCDSGEQLAVHYHAHIDLIYRGQPVTIPASTGITGSCDYWMHTHSTSGIVHIEAPKESASRQFTTGDFFAIWNQPLSKSQVATFPIGKGDSVKVWVDGKPYTGDPAKIVLRSHTQVVIEVGPQFVDAPTFDWSDPKVIQEAGSAG
jgi:hypothetical protein